MIAAYVQGYADALAAVQADFRARTREYVEKCRPRKRQPFPVDKAVALYNDGHSSREIGDEFGVDNKTVLAHLRNAGVTIKPQGGARTTSFCVGVTSRGRTKAGERIAA